MALLSWLDRKVDEPKAGFLSGIDLKYVLDTHHLLKKKLLDEMDGTSTEPLDVATISQDDVCAIGKWLYGEGKTLYGHLPEYETARQVHAELHLCAGEVLAQHQIGNQDHAFALLKTKYRSTSSKNQMEFTRLFKAAKVQP
jgi:hypothetical protein